MALLVTIQQHLTLHSHDWPAGLYTVVLEADDHRTTLRAVVR
jgi:hypothetical protein